EAWAICMGHVDENQRNVGIPVLVSLQLVGVPLAPEFVYIDHGVVHTNLLCLAVAHCSGCTRAVEPIPSLSQPPRSQSPLPPAATPASPRARHEARRSTAP